MVTFTPPAWAQPVARTVQFSLASETVNESAGTFSITVTQSFASVSDTIVPFTLGGTAVAGTDFSGVTASPLVIPVGQTSAAITGNLLSDPGNFTETLTFTLGTPTNAELGSITVNTLSITQPAPSAPAAVPVPASAKTGLVALPILCFWIWKKRKSVAA